MHEPLNPRKVKPGSTKPWAYALDLDEYDEEEDAGGKPGYGSLMGLNMRKTKKTPVLVLDPEEAEQANRQFELISTQQMDLDEKADHPGHMLGLEPMQTRSADSDADLAEEQDWSSWSDEPADFDEDGGDEDAGDNIEYAGLKPSPNEGRIAKIQVDLRGNAGLAGEAEPEHEPENPADMPPYAASTQAGDLPTHAIAPDEGEAIWDSTPDTAPQVDEDWLQEAEAIPRHEPLTDQEPLAFDAPIAEDFADWDATDKVEQAPYAAPLPETIVDDPAPISAGYQAKPSPPPVEAHCQIRAKLIRAPEPRITWGQRIGTAQKLLLGWMAQLKKLYRWAMRLKR